MKQVVQEHCRENGHAWLLTAAHVLQLPMAQSTPLPPLSSSQDTNITSEVNGRQKELGCGRKESHQSGGLQSAFSMSRTLIISKGLFPDKQT